MTVKLSDLDLAALLCSRVCHDVISPVGAVANGLEVLDEEDDEEMRKMALDLVRRSAKQASAKLQFCRIAFGAAGQAGAMLDLGEAGEIAKLFVGEEKIKLDWQAPRGPRDKTEAKLLLNMMLMAMAAIPRGGVVTIKADDTTMSAVAEGEGARIPEKTAAALAGTAAVTDFDARLVQVYYAMRLAEQSGSLLTMGSDGNRVSVAAQKQIAADAVAATA
ncbi:MAG: histidine phosphotransferase family protein [Hyphomicrobiales bacterium]